MKQKLFIFILILLPVSALFAQEDVTVFPMTEVVVTASKQLESKGNVTQKIDVITDSTLSIIVLPNNNLSEAIGRMPGSSVRPLSRNDANWGTYGGIGPKYCTYMLQGLPIDAFVDPMALDISAIARIEVQRGPASVLYPNYLSQDFAGNQSPLTGTINLILKDKIDGRQTNAWTSYGSYNTINSHFFHQDTSTSVQYFFGATYERSDYTNYGTANSWLNMKKNPEYTKTKLYGGATIAVDDKQQLSLFVNKAFHSGDVGRVYRGFENEYTIINAGYSSSLTHHVSLQSHFGLRQYDRLWQESNYGSIDTLKSNNGVTQNIIPIDINLSIHHGSNDLLIVGADYQHAGYGTWSDPLRGYRQFGNKSNGTQAGVYGQEELRLSNVILRAGLRYSYTESAIDLIDGNAPGMNAQHWHSLLWSCGVRIINENIALFANGGNSFIVPGLKSTGGTIALSDRSVVGKNGQLPNPNLLPESGIGADLGTDIRIASSTSLGLRAFIISVNDAIIDNVVSLNPSQSQSINAGTSHSSGFEVEASQKINTSIAWFANYTFMKTTIDNPSAPDQDGTEIPFAPAQSANLGVDVSFDFGLQLHPSLNYSSDFFDSNSKAGRKAFAQGTIINLLLIQTVTRREGYATELTVAISNFTNNRYEMPWQFINTGRAITGGLRVRF